MTEVLIVYIVIYVVYGAILGCLCSYIAGTKNRDKVGYFFLGFFFGIIGLIVAAAVPKNDIVNKQSASVSPPKTDLKLSYILRHKASSKASFKPTFEKSIPELQKLDQVSKGLQKYAYGAIEDGNFLLLLGAGIVFEAKLTDIINITSFNEDIEEVLPNSSYMGGAPLSITTEMTLLEIAVLDEARHEMRLVFNYGNAGQEYANQIINEDISSIKTAIVKAQKKDSEAIEELIDDATKKCPFCAEIVKAEAIKCKHCGSMLDESK